MRVIATNDGAFSGSLDQSPDGSLIAVDRLDPPGYVLIDPADGRILEEVTTDHQPGDDALSFGPDGDTLAVAYQGGRDEATGAPLDYDGQPAVERFAVPGGRVLGSLDGPPGSYHFLAHDATGQWLAALRLDLDDRPTVVVWDVAAGGSPRSLGAGNAFGFLSGTGAVVVLGPEGTGLTVVDVATADVIREIATPDDLQYFGLEVDPTGRLVALEAPTGRTVDVLDLTSGALESRLQLPSPTFSKFSPDGRQLAVRGNDSLIRIFDTESFTERQRLAGMPGDSSGLAFSPDGSRFVGAAVGSLRSWDLSPEGPAPLGNFHVAGGLPGRLTLAADESTALVSVYTGERTALHRVDLTSGEDEEVLSDLGGFATPVVKPDLSAVATLDREYTTNLIDLASGGVTKLGRCEALSEFDQSGRLAAIDGQMLCTDFDSPAPLPGPGVPSRVVDLATGRTVLDLGDTPLFGAVFGPPVDGGPPGLFAVLNPYAAIVTVYDLTTGAEVGSYRPQGGGAPLNFAMSPDGRRLAVTTTDGKLAVVDLTTLARVEDPADAVAWTVTAHGGSVQAVSVSESGWIATASSAGEVRVWSPDGALFADLPLRLDDPPTLGFAPGTDTLYYEDGGGVFRRFVLDTDENVRLARSLLTRGFTEDECARYFPDQRCPTFDR